MPRLHLDTDFGGDIDDLCALAMILNWPDTELVGVTTNSENGGRRAGYTRYALSLAGRQDVPVAAGADAESAHYRIYPGLPKEADYWPEPVPPAPGPVDKALDLLETSIQNGAIIAAVGACTNLALLEKRTPGILRDANLFIMGGYVFPPRDAFPQWGREMDWNLQNDVESARVVLEASSPTLVPLSVTVETYLRRAHLERLARGAPLPCLIARQAKAFARDQKFEELYGKTSVGLPDDTINFLHDPLACAIALGWDEAVEIAEIPLKTEIQDGWLHQEIDPNGKPTRVVTKIHGEAFSHFWLERIV